MARWIAITVSLLSVLLEPVVTTGAARAGDTDRDWTVECGGPYNLCGYDDKATTTMAIPRQFERAFEFSEGLAGVRINGRYGYADRNGDVVIAPRFDLVGAFHNGHAEVVLDDHTGIIDTKGRLILDAHYARAIPFGNNAALVRPGNWTPPHAEQTEQLETDYIYETNHRQLFDLVDISSRKVLQTGLLVQRFDSEKYVWADRLDGLGIGLLASDGRWKIAPRFWTAGQLYDGRATVCEQRDSSANPFHEICGAVNAEGVLVLGLQPYAIASHANGFYLVWIDGKEGVLDESGTLLGGRAFESVDINRAGDVIEVLSDGKWVGLDRRGRIVGDPQDGKVLAACPSGVKLVTHAHMLEVLGPEGTKTAPYLFDNSYIEHPCSAPMMVRYKGKWSFVGGDGRLLFDPPPFEDAHAFNGGFAAVELDGKWGIIDTSGSFTLRPQLPFMRPDHGLFYIQSAHQAMWIDAFGQQQAEPDRADERAQQMLCPNEGGRIVSRMVGGTRLWGLADEDGNVTVEPRYRAITCFRNGLAWVPVDAKKAWCPIDYAEHIRDNIGCTTMKQAVARYGGNPEQMSDDPYESGVLWMRAELDYGLGVRDHPPRIFNSTSF